MPLDKILFIIFKIISILAGVALGFLVFELPSFWSELEENLENILFQAALALLALYATSSSNSTFVSAFLLSALARSFYIQYHDYKKGVLNDWFRTLKDPPTQRVLVGYFVVVGFVFLYSLMNFLL